MDVLLLYVLVLVYIAGKYYLIFGSPFFILVGCVAVSKGRSFIGWFLLSVLFSPLLILIALAAVPSRKLAFERV